MATLGLVSHKGQEREGHGPSLSTMASPAQLCTSPKNMTPLVYRIALVLLLFQIVTGMYDHICIKIELKFCSAHKDLYTTIEYQCLGRFFKIFTNTMMIGAAIFVPSTEKVNQVFRQ